MGTEFEIVLPMSLPESKPPSSKRSESAEKLAPIKVLWVDDEEMIRKTGQKMMKILGHHGDSASCGMEALELLKTSQYDLLITDVGMPGMSGYQLIEKIRELYPETTMKVAVITGWGDLVSQEKKQEMGVGYVIGKPFELKRLQDILREVAQMK